MSMIWIAAGGALGACMRMFLMRFLPEKIVSIPLKIMVVNIIGCFLIGALTSIFLRFDGVSHNVKQFLIPGFLGGLTTFSAFSLEYALLFQKGLHFQGIVYVLLSVSLGVLSLFLGMKIMRLLLI
ncbi:MAG TPA: fluoride efflux transporter CrcB [Chlamydiales bacterium]|nr:fluoride efflux transporter CrcB [Chlamydiales bacterium]